MCLPHWSISHFVPDLLAPSSSRSDASKLLVSFLLLRTFLWLHGDSEPSWKGPDPSRLSLLNPRSPWPEESCWISHSHNGGQSSVLGLYTLDSSSLRGTASSWFLEVGNKKLYPESPLRMLSQRCHLPVFLSTQPLQCPGLVC